MLQMSRNIFINELIIIELAPPPLGGFGSPVSGWTDLESILGPQSWTVA